MRAVGNPISTRVLVRTLLHLRTSLGWIYFGRRPPRLSRPGSGLAVRQSVAVLLLITLLLGGVQQAASAPDEQDAPNPSSVRMDVRAGFDGSGRVGGWIPLDVNLVKDRKSTRLNS